MKGPAQTLTVQFTFVCGLIVTGYLSCAFANQTTEVIESEFDDNDTSDDNGIKTIIDHLTTRNNALIEIALKIPYLQLFLPLLRFHTKNHNGSVSFDKSQCNTDLAKLGLSLTNKWILPLIDSYGKPASGITQGAVFWPGNYDQCTSFQSPNTKLFPSGLKGRYCLLVLSPVNISLEIQTGICVPNSCDSSELNNDNTQIRKLLSMIPKIKTYVEEFPDISFNCLPENVPLNSAAIGCVVLLAIVFSITISGTLYDAFKTYYQAKNTLPISFTYNQSDESKYESASNGFESSISEKIENDKEVLVQLVDSNIKNWVVEVLLCFSVIRNGKSIFDTSERPDQLNCLHGIRFISITWVILGHTYVFGMAQFSNLLGMFAQFKTWHFQAIANATFSVDTFFLLSGFLLTYLFLKDRSKFTIKKLGSFYLHRYIRLTPVYMVVLFTFGTVFNFTGDGPYWGYNNQESNLCTKHWWWNLLYINNFASVLDMCMGWSWYLSNDMQFFIISPVFLVLLKSQRLVQRYIGFGIICALLMGSWITIGVISGVNSLPIMFEGLGNDNNIKNAEKAQYDEFNYIYDKPYTRIGPYLIGCLLGFAIIELKGVTKFLNTRWTLIGWFAAFALALTVVYGLYNTSPDTATSAFYNSLARSAWSVAVSWVILASLTGHGGFINKFLSWKFFFPLSRLTYCAYLTHPLVIYYYYQTLRSSFYISSAAAAVHYLGFTVLTYGLALITSLAFEAPVIKLEKLIRQGPSTN